MQKFDVFREEEGTRNVSDKGKCHLYLTCAIRRRKLVSCETDSEFSVNSSK